MSTTQFVTRANMLQLMSGQYNSELTETFDHSWARVDIAVIDQGENTVENANLDFHLLEICLSGAHVMHGRYETEQGDSAHFQLVPGSIGYTQPAVPVTQDVTGHAKYQQTYIDDIVFRETAQSVLKGDPDRITMLGFQGVFDPHIKGLAAKLLDEARCPAVGSDLRADLIIQEIALLMLRRRAEDRFKLPKGYTLSKDQLSRVVAYLEDQIEDIGGMDTLARLVDMDVYSFSRAFKLSTGETPGQFLIQRRLTRVKDLLRNTDDTLADITYATGFSNQPHMTSTFTKHVGVSPGKWRNAVRS